MSNKKPLNEGYTPTENRGFQPRKIDNGFQPTKSIKTKPPITPPKKDPKK